MMSWIKAAASNYSLKIHGKKYELSEKEVEQVVQRMLRTSSPIQKMFLQFGLSLDILNNLDVKLVDLKNKYALTDSKTMKINRNLFRNENFFEQYWFLLGHECMHFIARNSEKKTHEKLKVPVGLIPEKPTKSDEGYFSDQEEGMAFALSVACEIDNGTGLQEIWRRVFPKVKWHFHDEKDAIIFFKDIISKAKNLL